MVEKDYLKEGSPGEMQLINKEDSPDSTASNKGDPTTHYPWPLTNPTSNEIPWIYLLLTLRPMRYSEFTS